MSRPIVAAAAVLALALGTSPAFAIGEYESEDGENKGDLIGFFRMSSNTTRNPGPELLYPHDNDTNSVLIARLLGHSSHGDHLQLSMNVLQTLSSTTTPLILAGEVRESGRSDALSWRWNKDREADAELTLDHLNARISADWLDVLIGRQPVSLATSYLFTPNDFFSPFSAQTFFRTYKPGVDAVRVVATVGEFTQIAAYGVAGYAYDPDNVDRLSLSESAGLVRASTVIGDFEVATLAGSLPHKLALGGDFQGEVGEWLGVRGEGHVAVPERREGEPERDPRLELSMGLEHRFDNTLFLRLEYFWHGAGLSDVDEYATVITDRTDVGAYLGRQYLAAAAGYELTPLLNLDSVLIGNLVDGSVYGSLYLLYSVADEAELAVTAAVPLGDKTSLDLLAGPAVGSEFGLYPASLGADFRLYW
jgi:hypothetical protein